MMTLIHKDFPMEPLVRSLFRCPGTMLPSGPPQEARRLGICEGNKGTTPLGSSDFCAVLPAPRASCQRWRSHVFFFTPISLRIQ